MKRLPLAIFALLATASPARAADATRAPFGLNWGQTQEAVTALGLTLTDCEAKETEIVCDSSSVPAPPPHAEIDLYFLRFDKVTGGLVAVSFGGATIVDDPDGVKGKAIYDTLRADLVATYGEGTRSEKSNPVYPDGFYACVKNDACGEWRSTWFDGLIVLSLKGFKPGQGFIMENFYKPS